MTTLITAAKETNPSMALLSTDPVGPGCNAGRYQRIQRTNREAPMLE